MPDFLHTTLFSIGGAPISLATLFTAAGVFLGALWGIRLAMKALDRALTRKTFASNATVALVQRVVRSMLITIAVMITLQVIGIDLSALFAAGAVFAVGAGVALQQIAQSFVAGFLLLMERDITPGDVLEVQGRICRVERIGIRTTVVRTLEEDNLLVPNVELIQNIIRNYTYRDMVFRVEVIVGVAYDTDLERAKEILEAAAAQVPGQPEDHPPKVLVHGFANSAIELAIRVATADPWRTPEIRSRVCMEIWRGLRSAGITIAFPQLDVHLDPIVLAPPTREPSPTL